VSRERIEALVTRATSLSRGRAWGEAAPLYARAAVAAKEMDELEVARRAWGAAGEAWRRDDSPREAARALTLALGIPTEDADAVALNRIRLAGVLAEIGNTDAAQQLCEQALSAPELGGPVREMARDALVGVLLGVPDKEAVRPLVDSLCRAGGDSAFAGEFRRGQLARLDGALDAAHAHFETVIVGFGDRSEGAAAVAAARSEQAEIHLLRGDTQPAVVAYERGKELHEAAGRWALVYRCEAGRVRAMTEAGIAPLTGGLQEGIDFARAREMVMLEADLCIARGMARAGQDSALGRLDFERAIALAEAARSGLRAGRARLEWATRCAMSEARQLQKLREAAADLAQSAPLLARVDAAIQRMAGADRSR